MNYEEDNRYFGYYMKEFLKYSEENNTSSTYTIYYSIISSKMQNLKSVKIEDIDIHFVNRLYGRIVSRRLFS